MKLFYYSILIYHKEYTILIRKNIMIKMARTKSMGNIIDETTFKDFEGVSSVWRFFRSGVSFLLPSYIFFVSLESLGITKNETLWIAGANDVSNLVCDALQFSSGLNLRWFFILSDDLRPGNMISMLVNDLLCFFDDIPYFKPLSEKWLGMFTITVEKFFLSPLNGHIDLSLITFT